MLSENIKNFRKAKGLSQEELAAGLNVVRQTVSKWEQGLSVPDADLLIALSEALEVPVSTLLGETVKEPEAGDLKAIARKLEVVNHQLAEQKESKRKIWQWIFLGVMLVTVGIMVFLWIMGSPYSGWDYSDPEKAVIGVAWHSFEWIFVRVAPFVLAGSAAGLIMTGRKGR